jgi:hypothetical protein
MTYGHICPWVVYRQGEVLLRAAESLGTALRLAAQDGASVATPKPANV